MGGDKWEDKPNSYHVVFFDDKEITRAWVPSARLRKFDRVKPVSAKSTSLEPDLVKLSKML